MPTAKEHRRPIDTAPKDGTVIVVGHDDVGEFVMKWAPSVLNLLVGPTPRGMWLAVDGSFTWDDSRDAGPDYWRPASH